VKIDETREDEKTARVEDLCAVRGESFANCRDCAVAEGHVEITVASRDGIYEPPAPNEEIRHGPSRSPSHGRPVRSR